jgi:hypothetical protein
MNEKNDPRALHDDRELDNRAEDPRKPYEPPRLLKKRSVARATLFTAMGPTTNAITMMG